MYTLLRQLFIAMLGGVVTAGILLAVNRVEPEQRIALAQTSTSVITPQAGQADARKMINYQGQVFNPNGGAPYINTGLNFSFRLYNNPQGTNEIYREDQHIITNQDGFFSANIGVSGTIDKVYDIFNGQELYLRVYINDQELTPLQPITFVPYAFWSVHAHHLDNHGAEDFPKIVAFGVINANGSKRSGKGFSSSRGRVGGDEVYIIDLHNAPDHSVDDYTTVITPACASPVVTGIGSSLGDLVVDIWDTNGARVQCSFQFITFVE